MAFAYVSTYNIWKGEKGKGREKGIEGRGLGFLRFFRRFLLRFFLRFLPMYMGIFLWGSLMLLPMYMGLCFSEPGRLPCRLACRTFV